MANDLSNIMPKILARGLKVLRQRCSMPRLVNSDYSNDAKEKGDTIDVPISVASSVEDVAPANVPPAGEDTTPTKIQIALDRWKQCKPFHLSDKDMANIDKNAHFLPGAIEEGVKALANYVNQDLLNCYLGVYGYVGTAGTTPFGSGVGVQSATNIRKVLSQQLTPADNRRAVIDHVADAAMLSLAEFSDVEKVGDPNIKLNGEIGRKYGIDWYADDHVPRHTAGTITTGLIAKAATAQAVGDTSIVCTTAASTGACALLEGDIVEFAGDSQTYVLTAAATQASAATDVTLNISPGKLVALTGSEEVTVKASHRVNLAFHREAIAFATRPLVDNENLGDLGQKVLSFPDPISGLTLRLTVMRQWMRVAWVFDILWGRKLVRPEFAARLAG
jgi:hypothetical protein